MLSWLGPGAPRIFGMDRRPRLRSFNTDASKYLRCPGPNAMWACSPLLLLLVLLMPPYWAATAAKGFASVVVEDVGVQAWQRRLAQAHPSAHGRLLGEFGVVSAETQDSTGSSGEPQEVLERVDWRARSVAVNLGSRYCQQSSGQFCGPCNQLPNDPCQVIDGFGADTSICVLPGFLGGTVSETALCGVGTAMDVPSPIPDDPVPAARMAVFRNTTGHLLVSVTMSCGWLLVVEALAGRTLEGRVTYSGITLDFFHDPPSSAERKFSCVTAAIALPGLTSSCQALDMSVDVSFYVQRFTASTPSTCDAVSSRYKLTQRIDIGLPQNLQQGNTPSSPRGGNWGPDDSDVRATLAEMRIALNLSNPATWTWLDALEDHGPISDVDVAGHDIGLLLTAEISAGSDPASISRTKQQTVQLGCDESGKAHVQAALVSALGPMGVLVQGLSCRHVDAAEIASTDDPMITACMAPKGVTAVALYAVALRVNGKEAADVWPAIAAALPSQRPATQTATSTDQALLGLSMCATPASSWEVRGEVVIKLKAALNTDSEAVKAQQLQAAASAAPSLLLQDAPWVVALGKASSSQWRVLPPAPWATGSTTTSTTEEQKSVPTTVVAAAAAASAICTALLIAAVLLLIKRLNRSKVCASKSTGSKALDRPSNAHHAVLRELFLPTPLRAAAPEDLFHLQMPPILKMSDVVMVDSAPTASKPSISTPSAAEASQAADQAGDHEREEQQQLHVHQSSGSRAQHVTPSYLSGMLQVLMRRQTSTGGAALNADASPDMWASNLLYDMDGSFISLRRTLTSTAGISQHDGEAAGQQGLGSMHAGAAPPRKQAVMVDAAVSPSQSRAGSGGGAPPTAAASELQGQQKAAGVAQASDSVQDLQSQAPDLQRDAHVAVMAAEIAELRQLALAQMDLLQEQKEMLDQFAAQQVDVQLQEPAPEPRMVAAAPVDATVVSGLARAARAVAMAAARITGQAQASHKSHVVSRTHSTELTSSPRGYSSAGASQGLDGVREGASAIPVNTLAAVRVQLGYAEIGDSGDFSSDLVHLESSAAQQAPASAVDDSGCKSDGAPASPQRRGRPSLDNYDPLSRVVAMRRISGDSTAEAGTPLSGVSVASIPIMPPAAARKAKEKFRRSKLDH